MMWTESKSGVVTVLSILNLTFLFISVCQIAICIGKVGLELNCTTVGIDGEINETWERKKFFFFNFEGLKLIESFKGHPGITGALSFLA